MNKKFAAFYESQGMTVVKNKAYGVVRGYETNAQVVNVALADPYAKNNYPCQVHISFYATSEQKAQMESALRNATLKYFKFAMTECGLKFSFTGMTNGSIVKRLPELFDIVFGIVAENGGKTSEYCPYCGELLTEDSSKKCEIGGNTVTLEYSCLEKINTVIDAENAEFKAAPNKILLGTVGALIGGVAGAVVSVILLMIGYVAFLSAIVSVLLGSFLYQKFGGKPNLIMLVIVCVVTLAFMALSVVIGYIIASGMAAAEAGLDISAFEAFGVLMEDSEFSSLFFRDLALSLVFAVVGTVIEIVYLSQSIKRKKRIS